MRHPISISIKGKPWYSRFYYMLYSIRNMYPSDPFPISKMGDIIDDEVRLQLEEEQLLENARLKQAPLEDY